jgi:hypothetical protein
MMRSFFFVVRKAYFMPSRYVFLGNDVAVPALGQSNFFTQFMQFNPVPLLLLSSYKSLDNHFERFLVTSARLC